MFDVTPSSPDELALILKQSADLERTICVRGNGTKDAMGGPVLPAEVTVSTAHLRRVLNYEPRDLTVSVEAGFPFSELQALLAEKGQMIALDPPSLPGATIGGVVASNSSGPMRLAFGTARDMVIGMTFATLNGHLVKVGGMVVKNVAGLDLGKLMIGSFGTLGVITSVNFRVHSRPTQTRTFLFLFKSLDQCFETVAALRTSKLRPYAVDLLSPGISADPEYLLTVRAAGSDTVLERYTRELRSAEPVSGAAELRLWDRIRNFTLAFLKSNPEGVVLKISANIGDLRALVQLIPGPCIAHPLSGLAYVYLAAWEEASPLWAAANRYRWNVVVEYVPERTRIREDLWRISDSCSSQSAFAMMEQLKRTFDPKNLLNRSRLYGRI